MKVLPALRPCARARERHRLNRPRIARVQLLAEPKKLPAQAVQAHVRHHDTRRHPGMLQHLLSGKTAREQFTLLCAFAACDERLQRVGDAAGKRECNVFCLQVFAQHVP